MSAAQVPDLFVPLAATVVFASSGCSASAAARRAGSLLGKEPGQPPKTEAGKSQLRVVYEDSIPQKMRRFFFLKVEINQTIGTPVVAPDWRRIQQ
jgi:hypothetical protein